MDYCLPIQMHWELYETSKWNPFVLNPTAAWVAWWNRKYECLMEYFWGKFVFFICSSYILLFTSNWNICISFSLSNKILLINIIIRNKWVLKSVRNYEWYQPAEQINVTYKTLTANRCLSVANRLQSYTAAPIHKYRCWVRKTPTFIVLWKYLCSVSNYLHTNIVRSINKNITKLNEKQKIHKSFIALPATKLIVSM